MVVFEKIKEQSIIVQFGRVNRDGIPLNNNNAKHAIKAFLKYRRQIDGTYNETDLKEYLILLSIPQTRHYVFPFLFADNIRTKTCKKY